MAKLEDLTRSAWVKGVLPDALVNAIDVKWHGAVPADPVSNPSIATANPR